MAADPDNQCLQAEIEVLRQGLFRVIEANGGNLTSEEVLAFSRRLDEAVVMLQLRMPGVKEACDACAAVRRVAARISAG
ncbi:MAG: aspartyl-phosphate phosphatase Spo0E family protein [Bacillota bacterium]|nr:aspartyl-phosphate phosphatase Spo0E family protein [Bacillota bacterium]